MRVEDTDAATVCGNSLTPRPMRDMQALGETQTEAHSSQSVRTFFSVDRRMDVQRRTTCLNST